MVWASDEVDSLRDVGMGNRNETHSSPGALVQRIALSWWMASGKSSKFTLLFRAAEREIWEAWRRCLSMTTYEMHLEQARRHCCSLGSASGEKALRWEMRQSCVPTVLRVHMSQSQPEDPSNAVLTAFFFKNLLLSWAFSLKFNVQLGIYRLRRVWETVLCFKKLIVGQIN